MSELPKLIPMVEAARNWVQIKAYELEGEKRDTLLAILGAAIEERAELEAENQRLLHGGADNILELGTRIAELEARRDRLLDALRRANDHFWETHDLLQHEEVLREKAEAALAEAVGLINEAATTGWFGVVLHERYKAFLARTGTTRDAAHEHDTGIDAQEGV